MHKNNEYTQMLPARLKKKRKIIKMKRTTLYIIVAAISIIAAALIIKYISTDKSDVIRIGYKLNAGYQNYFVAKEKGIFDKHNVVVKGITFSSTNQMMQALILGQIDATAAGSIEVIATTEIKSPNRLKIYNTLLFNKENAFFSIIVPVNSKINSINDLKGKKIGVLPGSTTMAFLKTICNKFFSTDSLEIIQLEPRVQLQALTLRQVDALYTVDPIVTLSQTMNLGKILIKGPENIYLLDPMATGAGVISSGFYEKNKNIAERFIDAMNETIDYMRANELETRQIVAKHTNLEKVVADRINLINYWKLDETHFDDVQNYLNFLYAEKIIEKNIESETIYLSN